MNSAIPLSYGGQFVAATPPVPVNLDIGVVPGLFQMIAESSAVGVITQAIWSLSSPGCLTTLASGAKSFSIGGILPWYPSGSNPSILRWNPSTQYVVGQVVHAVNMQSPGVAVQGGNNLPVYVCTQAGQSGVSEPTWPNESGLITTISLGGTVIDGNSVWQAVYSAKENLTEMSMATAPGGTNPMGQLITPAPTGLGLTLAASIQSAGVTYDWIAA